MGFPMSEAYGLPLNAKSLVGSLMANLRQPLPIALGDGGGIQPKGIDRQSLLGAQVSKIGSDVASLSHVVEKKKRNSAERAEG